MRDPRVVRPIERITDLDRDRQRLVDRHDRRSRQARRQRLACEVLEDDVVEIAVPADVVNRADVRIVECRNRPRFLLEALTGFSVRGKRAAQHFDRNRPIEPRVACPIHLAHSTFTNGRDDFVGS